MSVASLLDSIGTLGLKLFNYNVVTSSWSTAVDSPLQTTTLWFFQYYHLFVYYVLSFALTSIHRFHCCLTCAWGTGTPCLGCSGLPLAFGLKWQHLQGDLSKVVLLEETPTISDIISYETYYQSFEIAHSHWINQRNRAFESYCDEWPDPQRKLL